MTDIAKLKAPFPPETISWRVGATNQDKTKGMALAYIDARDVMERLDEVCGMEGWQCRYPHANGKTVCEIGVIFDWTDPPTWIWKSDGAGDTDFEGTKGALSDAFKRAAVRWGIGRYLYGLDAPWVAIEPMGRSYKIKQSEMRKLTAVLTGKKPESSGPLKVTALKEQLHKLDKAIRAETCTDEKALTGVVTGFVTVIGQAEKDLPDWYRAAKDAIDAKRESFKPDTVEAG